MAKQVRLTLPDDLYKTLKTQADADDRTVANYIVHLLKQKKSTQQAPLHFPLGVRSPITAPIQTIPTPENPDRRPIVTCDTTHKK